MVIISAKKMLNYMLQSTKNHFHGYWKFHHFRYFLWHLLKAFEIAILRLSVRYGFQLRMLSAEMKIQPQKSGHANCCLKLNSTIFVAVVNYNQETMLVKTKKMSF